MSINVPAKVPQSDVPQQPASRACLPLLLTRHAPPATAAWLTIACLCLREYRSYTRDWRRATSSCWRPCSHSRCSSAASLTPAASAKPWRARRRTYLQRGRGGIDSWEVRAQHSWAGGIADATHGIRVHPAATLAAGLCPRSLLDVVGGAKVAGAAQEGAVERAGLRSAGHAELVLLLLFSCCLTPCGFWQGVGRERRHCCEAARWQSSGGGGGSGGGTYKGQASLAVSSAHQKGVCTLW